MKPGIAAIILVSWLIRLQVNAQPMVQPSGGHELAQKEINLSNIRHADVGPIMQGSQVWGYYFLCMTNMWEGNQKSLTQKLYVTDVNLQKIDSIEIVRNSAFSIWAAAFNGKAFAFVMHREVTRHLELVSFDKEFKQLGNLDRQIGIFDNFRTSLRLGVIPRSEANANPVGGGFAQLGSGLYWNSKWNGPTDSMLELLVPIENEGFLYYDYIRNNGKCYKITRFTNDLRGLWTTESDQLNGYDVATPGFSDSTYVGSILIKIKRPSRLWNIPEQFEGDWVNKIRYDLLVNNASDGTRKFRTSIYKNSRLTILPLKVVHLKDSDRFIVIGKYFYLAEGSKHFPVRRDGGFIELTFDNSGSLIRTSSQPWNTEVKKGAVIRILTTANGKMLAVMEGPGNILDRDRMSIVDLDSTALRSLGQIRKIGSTVVSEIFVETLVQSNEFTIWYINFYLNSIFDGYPKMLNLGAINFDGKSFTSVGNCYQIDTKDRVLVLPSLPGRVLIVKYSKDHTLNMRFLTTAGLNE